MGKIRHWRLIIRVLGNKKKLKKYGVYNTDTGLSATITGYRYTAKKRSLTLLPVTVRQLFSSNMNLDHVYLSIPRNELVVLLVAARGAVVARV
jgi:hypothetical protein